MLLPPPIPPLPPREFFRSDRAYTAAKAAHNRAVRQRENEVKWSLALMLAGFLLILGIAAVMLLTALYMQFGWKGPGNLLAAAGLFWVLVVQIRNRL